MDTDLGLTAGFNWSTMTPNVLAIVFARNALTCADAARIVALLDLRYKLIGHVSR